MATQDWGSWKNTLASAVSMGQKAGMSTENLREKADRIGDYLAGTVDPKNPEQAVLKELWQVGSDEEQEALASMIVKLVSDH